MHGESFCELAPDFTDNPDKKMCYFIAYAGRVHDLIVKSIFLRFIFALSCGINLVCEN